MSFCLTTHRFGIRVHMKDGLFPAVLSALRKHRAPNQTRLQTCELGKFLLTDGPRFGSSGALRRRRDNVLIATLPPCSPRSPTPEWATLFRICYSLGIIFDALRALQYAARSSLLPGEAEDVPDVSPTLTLRDTVSYGAMISGHVSRRFCDALPLLRTDDLAKIEDDANRLDVRFFGTNRANVRHQFRIRVEKTRFFIDVPGNACGIVPEERDRPDDRLRFTPHNTDSPIQQFLLLYMLTRLAELGATHYPKES